MKNLAAVHKKNYNRRSDWQTACRIAAFELSAIKLSTALARAASSSSLMEDKKMPYFVYQLKRNSRVKESAVSVVEQVMNKADMLL